MHTYYIHVHTRLLTCMHMYTYTYTHVEVNTRTHTHTKIHTNARPHACTHAHTHTRTYIHKHTYARTFVLTSPLSYFLVIIIYGLQVVTLEVHRSSLRWLICPAQVHFIFSHIADYIYDSCPFPNPDVGFSILVYNVEHTSFHFDQCARKFVLCLFSQCCREQLGWDGVPLSYSSLDPDFLTLFVQMYCHWAVCIYVFRDL